MCIALNKPAGITLTRDIYSECYDSNPDGAGFAYVEDGKIVIDKGYFNFDRLYEALKPHEQKALLVHFRIATHGTVNADNCHPWLVDCGLVNGKPYQFAVIHNGILDHPSCKDKSDTGHFVDDIMKPLLTRDPWFFDAPVGISIFEKIIGRANKLVIMRNDGQTYIINAKAGEVAHGTWFSNSGYKPRFLELPGKGTGGTPYNWRDDANLNGYLGGSGVHYSKRGSSHSHNPQANYFQSRAYRNYLQEEADAEAELAAAADAQAEQAEGITVVPAEQTELGLPELDVNDDLAELLPHLYPFEIDNLVEEAFRTADAAGVSLDFETHYEAVLWLRDHIRATNPNAAHFEDEEIDDAVLKRISTNT